MSTNQNEGQMRSAPTQESELYPDTDGKPMAASDEHRHVLIRILRVIEAYFRPRPDVYVSGDILMYYVQGDPRRVVSPDILVTFGIGQKKRRTYQVWVEGKPPNFVMELSSKNTYRQDLREKKRLYASLGIVEYFLCDIEGLYLPEPLMGFSLIDGNYHAVPRTSEGGVPSSVLGLDLHLLPGELHFYDPANKEWILTPEESAEARAEQETTQRQQAESRAEAAESRAEAAESEAADLRAQLARLQQNPQ